MGAVSPAGWGVGPLLRALSLGKPLPTAAIQGPTGCRPYRVRTVPSPATRSEWMAHPRLRRASLNSQFTIAAAIEALQWSDSCRPFPGRLGIVTGTHAACVRYSERFFAEVLRDPRTASPVLFPETVINAPASHLAAFLGGVDLTCSLIGDQTVFVQALVVAAEWLLERRADVCLVVAAEESGWPVADALRCFARGTVSSEGAGALVVAREPGVGSCTVLERVTDAHLYAGQATRKAAATAMRRQLPRERANELLVDARGGFSRVDEAETSAWLDWSGTRLSPRAVLGEGLSAATAWQCVAACAALAAGQASAANVSVVGGNQQAIGLRFALATEAVSSSSESAG
jgi:hypothetical protein